MWAGTWGGISFAACGGSCGVALGSVEAPPVAFLGIPSIRPLHVCFDGVRAESLCGGCVRGNGDRDVRIRDRQLVDEDARRGASASVIRQCAAATENVVGLSPHLQGWTKFLWTGALKGMADAQQQMFIRYSADQLKTNGQSGGREATRD